MVDFNDIPNDLLAPAVLTEFDGSLAQAEPSAQPYRTLLVSQRLGTGTLAALTPARVRSAKDMREFGGAGSLAAFMGDAYFDQKHINDTWVVMLNDAAAGVAATGAITVTAVSAQAGTFYLYVGRVRIAVAVAAAQTSAEIAAAIAAAVTAKGTAVPVTAAAVDAVVTLTCRWAGETGNGINLTVNYYSGEKMPGGVTLDVPVNLTGGATNPDLGDPASDLFAALGDEQYHVIVTPYTDTANLTTLATEMEARWDPLKKIEGRIVAADRGTFATLGGMQATFSSAYVSRYGNIHKSPPMPAEWAAAIGAVESFRFQNDPAANIRDEPLKGMLPPRPVDRLRYEDRDALLGLGVAMVYYPRGAPRIERPVQTWNTQGGADKRYRDTPVLALLSYFRWSFEDWMGKFSQHKIVDDDSAAYLAAGTKAVTPKDIRGECVALWRYWQSRAYVENYELFINGLRVTRRLPDEPTRVDVQMPTDIANQLYIIANQLQYLI